MPIACTINGERDMQALPAIGHFSYTNQGSVPATANQPGDNNGSNSLHEQDETSAKKQRP
jgi:hypothetical protein